MSFITKPLQELRQEYLRAQPEIQAAVTQEQKEFQAIVDQHAAGLLLRVHNALAEAINTYYGLQDQVTLRLPSHELSFANYELTSAIQQLFYDHCGLRIEKYPNDRQFVILHFTPNVKACTIFVRDRPTTLDFPALIAENTRRLNLWRDSLSTLAKRLIDFYKECLETLPAKHYGIPRELLILHYDQDAISRYQGRDILQLRDLEIDYDFLSSWQINQLTNEMNKLISHGSIALESKDASRTLQAAIVKTPSKTVKAPYYDYAAFYEQYDTVTLELQSIFDTIVRGAQFIPASKQFEKLASDRHMYYQHDCHDGIDFDLLSKDNLHDHNTGFIQTFEQSYPGARVIDIDFLSRSPLDSYYSACIQFTIGIDSATTDSTLLQQLQIEHTIRYIKKHRLQYLANWLIKQALNDFTLREEKTWKFQTAHPVFALPNHRRPFIVPLDRRILKRLPAAVTDEASHFTIRFDQITDRDFLQKLRRATLHQSGGLIEIDAKNSKYTLHFPES